MTIQKKTIAGLLFLFLFKGLFAQINVIAFDLTQVENHVLVSWTIGRGNTCADLEIERSVNGSPFVNVFTFPGICGDANFDQSYQWTDSSVVLNEQNAYRIKAFSAIVTDTLYIKPIGYNSRGYLLLTESSKTTVYFQNVNSDWNLQLYNSGGQLINQWQSNGSNYITIPRTSTSGVYILKLSEGDKNEWTERLYFH
jgi:hypothetical protein